MAQEPLGRAGTAPDAPAEDVLERAAAELTRLVLDDLGPVLHRFRVEAARLLGLGLTELTCLELLARGPRASGYLGERTGLTRSSVSRMLRRLEQDGHVERTAHPEHEQELVVALRAHPTRDEELAALRARVHRTMRDTARAHRLERPENIALVADVLIQTLACLHRVATDMWDRAAWERLLARRRALREAADRRRSPPG